MRYKTIFIDWSGTLSDSKFWGRWADDTTNRDKYDLIQKALFDSPEGQIVLHDWLLDLYSADNVLQYVSKATGIALQELKDELYYSAEHMTFTDPSCIETIQKLRKSGVKVVIASDNMDVFRLYTAMSLKLYDLFDDIITSDEKGAMKSQLDDTEDENEAQYSPFFSPYLEDHELDEGESVLIDNSADLKSTVSALGIDFMHVSPTHTLAECLSEIAK